MEPLVFFHQYYRHLWIVRSTPEYAQVLQGQRGTGGNHPSLSLRYSRPPSFAQNLCGGGGIGSVIPSTRDPPDALACRRCGIRWADARPGGFYERTRFENQQRWSVSAIGVQPQPRPRDLVYATAGGAASLQMGQPRDLQNRFVPALSCGNDGKPATTTLASCWTRSAAADGFSDRVSQWKDCDCLAMRGGMESLNRAFLGPGGFELEQVRQYILDQDTADGAAGQF